LQNKTPPSLAWSIKEMFCWGSLRRRSFFRAINRHSRVALLQSVPIRLKALKIKKTDLIPSSLGEHVKKKRLELGLTQKEAATHLGVTSFTVTNWEHGLRKPSVQHLPAICQFLGYDPEQRTPRTPAEWLAAKRRQFGWTQRMAAQELKVDPSTWSAWENGRTIMTKAHRQLVSKFIGISDGALYSMNRKR
jgi:transcriptional regulator with XRE-family HTH domain